MRLFVLLVAFLVLIANFEHVLTKKSNNSKFTSEGSKVSDRSEVVREKEVDLIKFYRAVVEVYKKYDIFDQNVMNEADTTKFITLTAHRFQLTTKLLQKHLNLMQKFRYEASELKNVCHPSRLMFFNSKIRSARRFKEQSTEEEYSHVDRVLRKIGSSLVDCIIRKTQPRLDDYIFQYPGLKLWLATIAETQSALKKLGHESLVYNFSFSATLLNEATRFYIKKTHQSLSKACNLIYSNGWQLEALSKSYRTIHRPTFPVEINTNTDFSVYRNFMALADMCNHNFSEVTQVPFEISDELQNRLRVKNSLIANAFETKLIEMNNNRDIDKEISLQRKNVNELF